MSSPGAASFSTLASYTSSAPGDRREPYTVNLPGVYPGMATAPMLTTIGNSYLTSSSTTSQLQYGSPPPSSGRAINYNNHSTPSRNSHNNPANNSPPTTPISIPNTPNPIRPRTSTQVFTPLPHLEKGDAHSINEFQLQYQYQSHRDDIHNHPIKEFFSMSSSSSSSSVQDYDIEAGDHRGAEEDQEELGWKDAYEVMIKVPLRGLAALVARTGLAGRRRAKNQRGDGIV